MLKKLTLVLCGVFFFACFAPAVSVAGHHHDKNPKVKEFKENKAKFIAKLNALLVKYEKAADDKKSRKERHKKNRRRFLG